MQKQEDIPAGVLRSTVHLHRPPTPTMQHLRGELLGNGYGMVGAPAVDDD